MIRRPLSLKTTEPVHVVVELPSWQTGAIDVRVDPNCTEATLKMWTASEQERSGELVAEAELRIDGQRLIARCREDGQRVSDDTPIKIVAVVPPGSTLEARTDVAEVNTGGLKAVDVVTRSGDVSVRDGQSVKVRTDSGRITLGELQGVDVRTTTGDVTVDELGIHGEIKTESGRIDVHELNAPAARFSTASGPIGVIAARPCLIQASSVTGSITVGASDEVAGEVRVAVVTGAGRVDIPKGSTLTDFGAAPGTGPRESAAMQHGGGRHHGGGRRFGGGLRR